MNKLLMQIRREFWECRASFLRTPMVMAATLMGLLLLGMVPLQHRISIWLGHPKPPRSDEQGSGLGTAEWIGTDPDYLVHGLATVYGFFTLVLLLVLAFYFSDALYQDRRDRSILFWKSLPVTERLSLLGKLLAGTLAAPAVYGAAAAITGGFFLLVFLVYAGVFWQLPVPGLGAVLTTYLQSIAGLALGWLMLALWLLPVFCWLLFSSALARKTPFLVALGIPAGVIVLEAWFLGSGEGLGAIRRPFNAAADAFQALVHSPWELGPQLAHALSAPAFWGGLLVSGVLASGAIWLRQHRWEL